MAKHYTDFGMSVYALDHRGHGKSEGDRWNVEKFDYFLDDLHYYIENVPYSVNNLSSYCVTSDACIWFGTHGGGINRLSKDGSYVNFSEKMDCLVKLFSAYWRIALQKISGSVPMMDYIIMMIFLLLFTGEICLMYKQVKVERYI